jgi:hypothetical protein
MCGFLLELGDLCPDALIMYNEGKNLLPFSAVYGCIYSKHFTIAWNDRDKECEIFLRLALQAVPSPTVIDTTARRKDKKVRLTPFQKLFCETLRFLPGYQHSYQQGKQHQLLPQHMMALCGDMFHDQDVRHFFDYLVRTSWRKQGSWVLMEKDENGNIPLHLACATQSRDYICWKPLLYYFWRDSHVWTSSKEHPDMFEYCITGMKRNDGMVMEVDTPRAVRAKNRAGELPLHIVLQSNFAPHIKFALAHILLKACPETAVSIHPQTRLFPFMIAVVRNGKSNCACLSTTFMLLGELIASGRISTFSCNKKRESQSYITS